MQQDSDKVVLDPTTLAQVVETTVETAQEPVPSNEVPLEAEPVVAPDPAKGDFGSDLLTDEGERLDVPDAQVSTEPEEEPEQPKPVNRRDFGL